MLENLEPLRRKLVAHAAEHAHATRTAAEERLARKTARRRLRHARQAQALAQRVAAGVQAAAHSQIAAVVSRCLTAVFGPETYQFKIAFEQKRGRTEARLLLTRGGLELDPLDSAGGGVVDVAAFALRLAALVLERPARRRLLCLDEPWKHLSTEYRPALRELVEVLAREMGVQFLLITHSPEFEIGKVVRL